MSPSEASTADGRSKKRPGVAEQAEIITHAAVQLFAERGTRAVSIGQICTQADISRPTFYRCFEDKGALIEKIYEDAVNTHISAVLLRGSLRNPEELKVRLDNMLNAIFEHSQLAQLVFVEASDPDSPAADIVDRNLERAADVLGRDLRRSRGNAPSRIYLKSVMAAIQWIVHDAIRRGLTPRAVREAKEAAYKLVLNSLVAES